MKKKKKRLMGVLSMTLIVAMVLTAMPYWPTGLLEAEAATADITSDASALLSDWTISNDTNLSASISTDSDGTTKVLTLDQTSTGSSMSGTFNTASILNYTPSGVSFSDGYTISADIKVVSSHVSSSNSAGIGIGDMVTENSTNYYAYSAFREAATPNQRVVYCGTAGTYGSTSLNPSAPTVSIGTTYSYSFQKSSPDASTGSSSSYVVSFVSEDGTYSKNIGSSNVNSAYFDATTKTTSTPSIILEGTKVEIRNLKVTDSNGTTVYDMQTAGNSAYEADCTVNIGDTNVPTYSVGGSYTSSELTGSISTALSTALTDGQVLSVTTNSNDTLSAALGSYSATVDAANKAIIIKAGTTEVAKISYTVAGVVKRLTLDANAVTYDFRTNILGLATSSSVPTTGLTSSDGCLTIYGSSSGNAMKWNGATHGASIYSGDTFAINVPAGMTTITFGLCAYGSASAVMKVGTEQVGDSFALKGVSTDSETKSVTYTATEPTTINIVVTGSGYLHYISAKTETVQPTATVTGTVDEETNGENLIFMKDGSEVAETTISDGSYSIDLSTGSQYTVAFENSDTYEITSGSNIDLTGTESGSTVSNHISYSKWDSAKTFSLMIGGTQFTVTPGSKKSSDFTVTAGAGGSVETATASEALVWANLNGQGAGTLSASDITNVSSNVTTAVDGNEITVTYTEAASNPISYKIAVKDNSATGVPKKDGTPVTYTFTENSVTADISSLHAKGSAYVIKNASVTSKDKLITFQGSANGIYFNDASHGIGIGADSSISVKVAGDATIDIANCAYSGATVTVTVTPDSDSGTGSITPATAQSAKAATDGDITTYTYTGSAATITFTYTGATAYIHSMTVTNAAPQSTENTQTQMPSIMDYGTASALTVSAVGQRLVLKQSGGTLTTVSGAINSNISYYAFDETADANKLTADVVLNSCGSSNSYGIFFGAFNGTYAATVGIRNITGLRGIYSKSSADMVGAGGINTTITSATVVSFTAQKTDSGFVIIATPKGGTTQTMTFSYNSASYLLFSQNGIDTPVSYGFIVAGGTATVTNMKYYDANGDVLYDQNECYTAAGTAPVVSSVTATPATTRDSITINWTSSTEADGDGRYVVQVSKDGSEWTDIATDITDKTYTYAISDAGNYKFRVCGMLGTNGERNTYVQSSQVDVIAALTTPSVSISSTESTVNLGWESVDKATRYEVYRYSYDETASNAKKIAVVTSTEYTDTDVEAEMPYYYYVIAYSEDNYSNASSVVWTVPSAGHSGQYQYEDADAGITITKKSYDTVYTNKITLEGIVESAGNVVLQVNGSAVAQVAVAERGTFAFDDITIDEGRNDVNLLVTDSEGNVTRQTFNFVYLTNYQKVVDASFTGNDGDKNADGIPTYTTVQAAVNSVSATNTDRVVILVKEGDYNEHLQVTSPYITLIGEDSTKTRIHFFDAVESPVGGDMVKRCAVYIQSTATGFSAENLTFENDYQYLGDGTISNESADALRSDANNASYVNIRIVGYQDTLCANQGTQYYYKCYITGNVDFIYGNDPRAYFNDCQIVFRYASAKNSGYVCAPKTSTNATYGLTFNNCQILSEDGCSGSKYYLARPWGQDGYATWINCYMGKILKTNIVNPYSDMSGALASAARFYEFGSYGPGYTINANRRQISSTIATKMTTAAYLTWDPYATVSAIGTTYTGTVSTTSTDNYVTTTYTPTTYTTSEGDDTGLEKFGIEGYAQSADVTGGGTLYETSSNYYQVSTAEEFLKALVSVKSSGNASVIELTADIALGCNEITNFSNYSSVIKASSHQALTNPILMETGVSSLTLDGMSNLTIYSKNGAKITHTTTDITNSSNIIIRNLKFDELWEWDEATSGNYDLNDWDYMTIEKGSQDIWVDHCTFYKAYDGVIDIKTPTSPNNITISWCQFLPGSENDTFFDAMMSELENNASKYTYYSTLLSEGMTAEQIYSYAYGQKKTHLLGQDDDDSSASNIRVTLANNYYKDSMDRMPRLRYGTAHMYNCILDAQDLRDAKAAITNSTLAEKIVSNGASSTCGAHILLENCFISGITNALNSGNGSSPHGYINAINSLYYLDGVAQTLTVTNNNTLGDGALIQDPTTFKTDLPYSDYTLYNADDLATEVQPYTGAGVLNMTTLQWEKTTYTAENHVWDDGVVTTEATCTTPGVITYTCLLDGEQKTEEIPALGHQYSTEWTIDKQPTTTEEGSMSHHCTICDDKTDVTVIPKIDASSTKISLDVQLGDNTPQTTIDTSIEDMINNELTADEATEVAQGAELKFYLDLASADSTISSSDKTLIENILKQNDSNSIVGQFLDISLFKKVGTSDAVKITDTKVGIEITLKISDSLKATDTSGTRTYGIVRVHNGVATMLDGVYNEADGTFTFTTDGFSTYALIYTETTSSNSNGNDNGTTGTDGITGTDGTSGTDGTTGTEASTGTDTTTETAGSTETTTGTSSTENSTTSISTEDTTSASSESTTAAATGDNTSMAWLLVLFMFSGMTIMVSFKKRKKPIAKNK